MRTLFYDVRSCTLNDNFKVYVVINRIRYLSIDEQGTPLENDRTFIYLVAPGKRKRNKLVSLEQEGIDNSAPGKLQAADQLAAILNRIHDLEKGNEPKYLLNTWDHGNGFGINKEQLVNNKSNANKDAVGFVPTTISKLETLKPVDNSMFWHPINFLTSLFTKSSREREKDKIMLDLLKTIPSYENGLNDESDHSIFRVNNKPITIRSSSDGLITKLNQLAERGADNEHFVNIVKEGDRTILEVAEGNGDPAAAIARGEIIEDGTEVLTNAELAEAITKSFGKVDILLMMNCDMMNVYTQFTMKENVDYLVAPPSSIGAIGYNYRSIFSKASQAEVTPEHLARCCVDSCNDIRTTYADEEYNPADLAVLIVLAVDLAASRQTPANSSFSSMDALLNIILSELDKGGVKAVDFLIVRDKPEMVIYPGVAQLYDILHWLNLLLTYFENKSPEEPPIGFIDQLRKGTTAIANSTNLLTSFPIPRKDSTKIVSGFSVYYPYENNFKTSEFFKQYFDKAIYASPFDNFKINWVRFLEMATKHT